MARIERIQTVILCGGRGYRMGSDNLPKPLFKIGKQPILSHIMNIYSFYGYNDFILSLGYKKRLIINYFKKNNKQNIIFKDTALNTNTGGRIKRLEKLIKGDIFFATYGDGLSNVNLKRLLSFHKKHKAIATMVAVRPNSQFGIIGIESHTLKVEKFIEKPKLDHWVNGGFFVFNREVFDYMGNNDVLESDTLSKLALTGNLIAYRHKGFWECMDTYKDNLRLNSLWKTGNAPWKQ